MTNVLEIFPVSGRAPLTVRFEVRGVRSSLNERIKLDLGDGATADSFAGPKLSGTLIEAACHSTDNAGRVCDYRFEHEYREAGTFSIELMQVGLYGTDPPSCGETKLLARGTISVAT